MLKSEVQHQFWLTKKTVQRKLGSKEDEHIVSSDAALDSKIVLLKSISDTCIRLNRILEQYQERLLTLSQEECSLGRFLREISKRSKTTGSSIISSGKAIYYCGQQRMSVRVPLLRLQHEVDIFRCRGVSDTITTLKYMEKERTEYRAALCWMKSLSSRLDPDNGKGLDQFRRSQAHVRIGKDNFDKLSLDCIQKIDLLAAARCNMFSHCLVTYMSAILQFSKKSNSTFMVVAEALQSNPRYDFFVLKDLSENIRQLNVHNDDSDQSIFFSEDFKDKECDDSEKHFDDNIIENILDEFSKSSNAQRTWLNSSKIDYMQTQDSSQFHLELYKSNFQHDTSLSDKAKKTNQKYPKDEPIWLNIFSHLDPFENLQSFDLKMCAKSDTEQT